MQTKLKCPKCSKLLGKAEGSDYNVELWCRACKKTSTYNNPSFQEKTQNSLVKK